MNLIDKWKKGAEIKRATANLWCENDSRYHYAQGESAGILQCVADLEAQSRALSADRDAVETYYGIADDCHGNGCEHGFKPAKDCPNQGCEKKEAHVAWERLSKGESNSGWIDCKVRMPEEHIAVLIWFEHPASEARAMRGERSCGHWRPEGGNGNFDENVSHWQPLPQPPK